MRNSIIRYGTLAVFLIFVVGLASVRIGADADTVFLVGGLAVLFVVAVAYTALWLNPRITILRLDKRSGHGNKLTRRGELYITVAGSHWQMGLGFEASQISVSELVELRHIKVPTPLMMDEEQIRNISLISSEFMELGHYVENDHAALRPEDQIIVVHGDVAALAADFARPVTNIQTWAKSAPAVWFQLVTIISTEE